MGTCLATLYVCILALPQHRIALNLSLILFIRNFFGCHSSGNRRDHDFVCSHSLYSLIASRIRSGRNILAATESHAGDVDAIRKSRTRYFFLSLPLLLPLIIENVHFHFTCHNYFLHLSNEFLIF